MSILDFRFAILDSKGIPMVSIQNLKSKIQNRSLLILFMHPVAAAAATVFFKFKPVRRVLFVFCRHVIPLFALSALQNYVISRHLSNSLFQIPDSRFKSDLKSGI